MVGVAIAASIQVASCGTAKDEPRNPLPLEAGTGPAPTEGVGPVSTLPGPAPEVAPGSWRSIDPGPLATRGEPKGVWTGSELLVVGGLAIEQYAAFDDGAAFDPSSGTWRRIAKRPVPGRILAIAWTGTELFAFGADDGIRLDNLASAHLYDPKADRWRAAAPPPRPVSHVEFASWTGREVLLWTIGQGLLYDPASDRWRDVPPIDVPGAATPGRAQWLAGADGEGGVLAVQATSTPANGGNLVPTLFLYDPESNRWRQASPLPPDAPTPMFTLGMSAWTGAHFTLQPDPAAPALLYDPAADEWHTLPAPSVARDAGTGFFTGVPLSGGVGVIRIGDRSYPLLVTDGHRWLAVPPPDGRIPSADAVAVWTGRDLLLWGRPDSEGAAVTANAAWAWRPDPSVVAAA